jgi:hypothetical protein
MNGLMLYIVECGDIPGCRRAIIARIRVRGPAQAQRIWQHVLHPIFPFSSLSRGDGIPKRTRLPHCILQHG